MRGSSIETVQMSKRKYTITDVQYFGNGNKLKCSFNLFHFRYSTGRSILGLMPPGHIVGLTTETHGKDFS